MGRAISSSLDFLMERRKAFLVVSCPVRPCSASRSTVNRFSPKSTLDQASLLPSKRIAVLVACLRAFESQTFLMTMRFSAPSPIVTYWVSAFFSNEEQRSERTSYWKILTLGYCVTG